VGGIGRGDELLAGELADRSSRATFLVATHDPRRLDSLASARLAVA
jgi:hypothetical protein